MKHIRPASKEARLAIAQNGTVCGWLFRPSNVKCVDADDPRARLLKPVAIP